MEPCHQVQFIGTSLDSDADFLYLRTGLKSLKSTVLSFIRKHWQSVKAIQRLLGLMASTTTVISLATDRSATSPCSSAKLALVPEMSSVGEWACYLRKAQCSPRGKEAPTGDVG